MTETPPRRLSPTRSLRPMTRAGHPSCSFTGSWLLPTSWDRWAAVFAEAGYAPVSPGWPDDPDTVEQANADPDVFANKMIGQVADHHSEIIATLAKKPAVIGHSFGGLLAQIIAGRGQSRTTVAIDAAPFPWRPTAADLLAQGGIPGPRPPGQSTPRSPVDIRAVPVLLRQRRPGRRGEGAVRHLRRPGVGRSTVPSRDRQPQPEDRSEGRHPQPRSWAAAHHVG